MFNKIFYGWWIVTACFLIGVYVASVVFFGFTAFFEPLIEEFGWSYTQVSLASSLRGLEMGILAPIVGFLVHRYGPRKLIFLGTVTVGLGLILLSLTQSLVMFYGSFVLLAFGAGGCTAVVLLYAVAQWFQKNVGKALGAMASGFGASGLLVPSIVWLIDAYNWRIALVILGLGMWIIGVPLSFVVRDKPERYGYLPDGRSRDDSTPEMQTEEVVIGFMEALKQRAFLYLSTAEVIRFMVITAVILHVMPYLSNVGITRSKAGLVAAAVPVFSIVGRFGFGWLADVLDKRYVMAAGLGLMGMGLLAFQYAQHAWAIYAFLLLFSPGFGGCLVVRTAILREYFGREAFGRLLGINMGAASLGGIIGPTLAGAVFDVSGSYHLIWLAFVGGLGLSTMLILRMKR